MTGALVNRRGRRPVALAAIAAALLVSVAGPAAATEVGYARRYGLGLMVGTPTGLSGKAWVAPAGAIDAGIGGYGYGARGDCVRDPDGRDVCDRHWRGQRALSLHVDYLWHSRIVEHPTLQLDWHIGAGPRATFYGGPCDLDCWSLGARAPVGLDLTFTTPAFLEVFFELAPTLYLLPGPFLALEGGLGVRAYF